MLIICSSSVNPRMLPPLYFDTSTSTQYCILLEAIFITCIHINIVPTYDIDIAILSIRHVPVLYRNGLTLVT